MRKYKQMEKKMRKMYEFVEEKDIKMRKKIKKSEFDEEKI